MTKPEIGGPGSDVAVVAESEPTDLVRLALEKEVSVEVIERLVALQERVSDRHARAAFVEALTAFRAECPPITRTRANTQFSVTRSGVTRSSMYAPLEEIDRVARPVAAKHGLVWTWDTRIEGPMMHVTCRLLHVMGHHQDATVEMPHESKAGSSAQQKYASAQTYGMRYSLIAALGITTADEDLDGNAPQGGGDPITEEQLADLEALMEESGADPQKFLAWLGVDKLENLPASELHRTVKALERKRDGK